MIALGIFTTWLTLTAAGFAGLSALGRVGKRDCLDGDAALAARRPVTSVARIPIPKALLG